jgi:hypothetical protein
MQEPPPRTAAMVDSLDAGIVARPTRVNALPTASP